MGMGSATWRKMGTHDSVCVAFSIHMDMFLTVRRAFVIAALAFASALGAAPASPLIEALEDPSRMLTLEGARAADARFSPRGTGTVNFGYSYSAWWLRFRLPAEIAQPADWLLEIAFPSLDSIDLYLPRGQAGGGTAWAVKRAGDMRPWDTREVKHRNHVLRLDPGLARDEWIYLRVESKSVVTVPVRLWQRADFTNAERDAQLAYGLFYGLVIALFLYNLMLCLTLRDRTYVWYVLYVAAFGFSLFVFDGFAFQYIWPDDIWWANHSLGTGLCLTLAFGALFSRGFLDIPRRFPQIGRLFLALSGLAGIGALLAASELLLSYGTILRTLSVLATGMAALSLYVAVRELLRGYRPARFFLLAWLALLVFIALGALRNYALAPTNFLTVNGLHIGLALDVLLLSFALADRISRVERALLEATRENERDLERRIEERTAELHLVADRLRVEATEREDLLAKLRAQDEDLRFMAQHDALTGLPNRHSMQQRLALAVELARRNRKKVGVMLVDLNRFKQLNDSRGHSTGDQALVTIAGRLRTSVRGSDTVARLGGDEFVVIAADLDRAEDASMIAEKMSDMVSLPVPLEGGPWTGGCAIGISVFPDDAEDPVALLALADKAMYRVKSGARKRYAFFSEG